MAKRRTSVRKHEREIQKRRRQLEKSQKAADKRERRLSQEQQVSSAPLDAVDVDGGQDEISPRAGTDS